MPSNRKTNQRCTIAKRMGHDSTLLASADVLNAYRLSFGHLVAGGTEAVIPTSDEAAQKLAAIDAGNNAVGTRNFSPGMNAGATVREGVERDPLHHGVAENVIDPGDLYAGGAHGDHVIDHRFHGTDDLNAHAAAHGPGFA